MVGGGVDIDLVDFFDFVVFSVGDVGFDEIGDVLFVDYVMLFFVCLLMGWRERNV